MYVAQLSDLGPPKRRPTLPEMAERVSFMEQLNNCIGHAAKLSDLPLNGATTLENHMNILSRTHYFSHNLPSTFSA